MKKIHNIFSSSKVRPSFRNPIIVDTREAQSSLVAALEEKRVLTVFETLDVGDYIVGNTVVERKTISDFIQSMIHKRLHEQLVNLKQHQSFALLIEGFDFNYANRGVHENALRGMILSASLDLQVPVFFSRDEFDSVNFLLSLLRRSEKRSSQTSFRPLRKAKSFDEQKLFVLEGFPGIGPVTAKRLLEKYETLEKVFGCSREGLRLIEKLDDETINLFLKLLRE